MSHKITYINQSLDTLLDQTHARLESAAELVCHLANEVVVRHGLAVLHDADNARLDLVLPFLVDHLLRLLALLGRLDLACDLHNLDARKRGREVVVECKCVVGTNVAALGRLGQYAELAARE